MAEGISSKFSALLLPKSKGCNSAILLIFIGLLSILPGSAYHAETLYDSMERRYGEDGTKLLNAWVKMLETHSKSTVEEKVLAVNGFFNLHINYTDDLLLWHENDYWATPLETMGTRGGDCEDFTIAKYMSLIEMGIPANKLRLIYVRASKKKGNKMKVQAHMVLGYYQTPNAIPLILDNIDPTIKPANQRYDLKPIYSFNRQGLWVGNLSQSQADPTSRLSPWRNVLQRMQEEGF